MIRRRWWLAFAAAILLHAGILSLSSLLLEPAPHTPSPPDIRAVKLVQVEPVESQSDPRPQTAAPPAAVPPPAAPQSPPATPSLAQASLPTPTPAAEAVPEPTLEPAPGVDVPTTPRDVNLYPADVIGRIAEPEQLEGAALAERRIKEWAEEWDAHRRASVGDTTPAIRELAKRFDSWFIPSNKSVAENANYGLGMGNASFLTRYLKTAKMYGTGNHLGIGGMPAQVAHIEVVVEIDHDPEGLPEHWRVTQSSGDSGFDDAALAAIRDGLEWSDPSQLSSDRPARRTEWSFEARAYRYFVVEYTLEPGLVAKGSDLAEYDDLLGKTQVLRRARLVAVVYWPTADGGPRPSGLHPGSSGDPG